ncbi:uncharacterized protein LOC110055503 [Orbicella faveolata]|uniref:uncharacterized protein LOC110055503 n=1 Tax=Orbicella faveolata TaxID=48498 RepID=UPI0009E50C19|nr:uncharacterized protein LOC110055503 [Orbicella faveolata]
MNSNQGFGLKKKGVGKKECEQDTGSILKYAVNDKCATQKSKPWQRAKVKATKSRGNEKSKTNRKTSQIRNAKQQQIRSPVHDEDEPDISNEGNESYLEVMQQLLN